MISFNLVVACNNLDALRRYSVYLTNFSLWENPSWFQKAFFIPKTRDFIGYQALRCYREILKEMSKEKVSIGLYDCSTAMFSMLAMADQGFVPDTANDLFQILAETELRFEIMKKPKASLVYDPLKTGNDNNDNATRG